MKSPRAKAATARAPRRWRTPPPLTRGSAESLEGMEILREVPGETGVLLWQAYRNVMFWATAEPGDRVTLFSPDAAQRRLSELLAADLPAAIVDALVAVGRMPGAPPPPAVAPAGRSLGPPDTTSGESIAESTRTISEWAEQHGHTATALAFTQ